MAPVFGFDPSQGPISPEQSQYRGGLGPRDAGGRFRARRPGGSLLWYGEAVEARIAAVALAAVQEIATAAAAHAIDNHPWQNDTGETEASVFVNAAELTPAGIARCSWGAAGAALFLEYGTVKMPAYPWLRPAQDATYPHLGALIAGRV